MKKTILTMLSLMMVTMTFAEIFQVQVKVSDFNSPQELLKFGANSSFRTPTGGFMLSNNTSNMLPVKNSRICSDRLPLINNREHEVMIVGKFVEWCTEVTLVSDGVVIARINGSNILSKGVKNFFILRDYETRQEGYLQFKISSAILNRARGTIITIKIGNAGATDEIDCRIINRYAIEGMMFAGTNRPATNIATINGVRNSSHTLSKNTDYDIWFQLNNRVSDIPQSLPTDFSVQLYNGIEKTLIATGNCSECSNLFVGRAFALVNMNGTPNYGVKFTFNSGNKDFTYRRNNGRMLLLADSDVGNWKNSEIPRDVAKAISVTFPEEHEPNDWGGYIYCRMAVTMNFGTYTNMNSITVGNGGDDAVCFCPDYSLYQADIAPTAIISGNNNNNAPIFAVNLSISTSNAFVFTPSNNATTADAFNGVSNVCLQANDTGTKLTTVAPLSVTILNNGGTITGALSVRFKLNGTTLATNTIAGGIATGNSVTTTYTRPENRICATRSPNNAAVCKRCGNGIRGVSHWEDEGMVIEVLNTSGTVLATKTIN